MSVCQTFTSTSREVSRDRKQIKATTVRALTRIWGRGFEEVKLDVEDTGNAHVAVITVGHVPHQPINARHCLVVHVQHASCTIQQSGSPVQSNKVGHLYNPTNRVTCAIQQIGSQIGSPVQSNILGHLYNPTNRVTCTIQQSGSPVHSKKRVIIALSVAYAKVCK